ncbi:ATP-binding protein [Paractinoplanes brasiliensis]|uniref:Putative ATPase n=1 Tax=Paractinoplanes brasiliensis TaxID=52695 RepID=A0A4R6JZ05_9ACTN|nr:LuxR family transcriptional regulator [Actinoplanes brasiliensis]TDO42123.1 putative ATPase [Actinoplanes brasiliensis]GID32014.1 LuxR family transcriptional regulator [Actinoplanes brasiliensis]
MPGFVGRAAEMKLLDRCLAEVRERTARTVLIGGDAGIGKTRLLGRFAATAHESGAHVLTAACEEHFGDPMPYGPLLEILEVFGRDFGEDDEAYRRLVDFFDRRDDHLSGPQQVFVHVRRMLQHVEAPLVLIIEDLHWADPSTLDLVRHLAQCRPEQRRLLLVCSYRSGGLARTEPLWQLLAGANFTRRVERAELEPFTLTELEELLDTGSGPPRPALVERCLTWSEGNPFYAEQLIAAGALDHPENLLLPADLQSVLLARLSGLGDDALRVLRVAAVAGRATSRRLLRRVSGLEAYGLGAAVQECFDRQMLVTGRDEETYRFGHALLREAVYRTTVRDIRVDLHTAMARALADDPSLSLTEGSAAAEMAGHWYQAGRRPEALAAAVRAGEQAMRTYAFTSAAVQFERALQLWPRVAEPERTAGLSHVRLLADAAESARWSGDTGRAMARIEAAVAEAGEERPDLLERQANYLWETGSRREAGRVYREAAGMLDGRPASAVKARVLAAIALARLHAGRYADGKEVADAAMRVAVEAGARAEEGRARNVAGLARGMLGQVTDGVELLRAAITLARQENHIEDLLRAYANLGLILENAGDLREAADAAMAGLAEARRLDIGATTQAMILANNAGVALIMLGEWDEAERILTEGLLDRPPAESVYPRLTLAELRTARGSFDRARELLASIEGLELNGDPRFLGPLHTIRALVALGRGDLPEAQREVARGVAALRDGENSLERLRLCAVGLRCAADQAVTDRAAAMRFGDELAREGFEARPPESTPETDQLLLVCRAERQRLRGAGTAVLWGQVADGWTGLRRPYEAAYARWRQAAAGGGREALLAAHREAVRLGAGPLVADVARLGRRFGIDLADRPYGLTEAELETLRLLCQGLDAAGIARTRRVTPRTAQTQIHRLYQKMGVHTQAQAMAKARADGVFT